MEGLSSKVLSYRGAKYASGDGYQRQTNSKRGWQATDDTQFSPESSRALKCDDFWGGRDPSTVSHDPARWLINTCSSMPDVTLERTQRQEASMGDINSTSVYSPWYRPPRDASSRVLESSRDRPPPRQSAMRAILPAGTYTRAHERDALLKHEQRKKGQSVEGQTPHVAFAFVKPYDSEAPSEEAQREARWALPSSVGGTCKTTRQSAIRDEYSKLAFEERELASTLWSSGSKYGRAIAQHLLSDAAGNTDQAERRKKVYSTLPAGPGRRTRARELEL